MDEIIAMIHESRAGREVRSAAIREIEALRSEIARLTVALEAAEAKVDRAIEGWSKSLDKQIAALDRAEKAEAALARAPAETAALVTEAATVAYVSWAKGADAVCAEILKRITPDARAALDKLIADKVAEAVRVKSGDGWSVANSLIDTLHCCDSEALAISARISGARGKPCRHPDGVQILEDAETIIRSAACLLYGPPAALAADGEA